MSRETEYFIHRLKDQYREIELIPVGSSLKLCMVAEGTADVYPRFAPTMEWDVAAGHAIVEQAGGRVIDVNTKLPLKYNKETLLNPFFIVERGNLGKQIVY